MTINIIALILININIMFLHLKRHVKKLLGYCYIVITDSAAITYNTVIFICIE